MKRCTAPDPGAVLLSMSEVVHPDPVIEDISRGFGSDLSGIETFGTPTVCRTSICGMAPNPDHRWANIVGAVTASGVVRLISFEDLARLASEWTDLVTNVDLASGPGSLLRTARSLFTHSWFDYDFMQVACFVGFQAMEAAFRELYPDADRQPFRHLVRRAIGRQRRARS